MPFRLGRQCSCRCGHIQRYGQYQDDLSLPKICSACGATNSFKDTTPKRPKRPPQSDFTLGEVLELAGDVPSELIGTVAVFHGETYIDAGTPDWVSSYIPKLHDPCPECGNVEPRTLYFIAMSNRRIVALDCNSSCGHAELVIDETGDFPRRTYPPSSSCSVCDDAPGTWYLDATSEETLRSGRVVRTEARPGAWYCEDCGAEAVTEIQSAGLKVGAERWDETQGDCFPTDELPVAVDSGRPGPD